jgi:hypothetical protein
MGARHRWPVTDSATQTDLFVVEALPEGQVSVTMAENPQVVSPEVVEEFRMFLASGIVQARWNVS